MDNTFEKDGKTYWATPTTQVRVNGIRQLSPFATFESCCEEMELADVIEVDIYPQYVDLKNGDEPHLDMGKVITVVKKERLSSAKDTRWMP
tara:strand:+ start:108 stop:380 length:273 start_codon:yes stop_codon:yes gene_type:complete